MTKFSRGANPGGPGPAFTKCDAGHDACVTAGGSVHLQPEISVKYIVVLLALGVGACADTTSPAAATGLRPGSSNLDVTRSEQTIPFSAVACNGETVVGTADQHVMLHFVETPSGRTISSIKSREDLSGIGLVTGTEYTGHQQIHDQSIEGAKGATLLKATSRMTLTGRDVPPTVVDIVTFFVENANGDPVVQKTEFNTSCN